MSSPCHCLPLGSFAMMNHANGKPSTSQYKGETVLTDAPWLKYYEKEVPAVIDIPDIPSTRSWSTLRLACQTVRAVRMIVKYLPLGIKIQSRLTYRQFDKASSRFAAALHGLGIRKGDRVAIMLPNILQQVIAFYGILKAGAVLVNTNPTYTARELQHQLGDSGARAIVMLSRAVQPLG